MPANEVPNKKSRKKIEYVEVLVESNGIEDTPLVPAFLTYISYGILILFGFFRDFVRLLRGLSPTNKPKNQQGFKSLKPNYEHFYTRNIYSSARHLFSRPVLSMPAITMDVYDLAKGEKVRSSDMADPNKIVHDAINIGSYNYLGFSEKNSSTLRYVIEAIRKDGVSTCCGYGQFGINRRQAKMEEMMAKFLGKEDCVTFGMGFATNSTNINTLVSKNCLILSDQYNHSSLVLGSRMCGATIRVFPHNDMKTLEKLLRTSIIYGHPRTRRPWRKIIIIVEGVYSMEGTICPLPELIRLKKQYKAYLYLDEAHSIGATGPNGRGIVDLMGCDPADVDILMGTFTKSFASCGGYIAASKAIVNHIRRNSHAIVYSLSMSPPLCEQIIQTLSIMNGSTAPGDGQRRFHALADNTAYLRKRLKELGYIVFGHDASPVVPVLVYLPGKISFLGEELLKRGIAAVGVGFPATSLVASRIRICMSAGHTRTQLDYIVDTLQNLETYARIQYRRRNKLS